MNIGIDMRLCGSEHGGIGRYSFEIAKHILQLDSQNNYFLFFNKKLVQAHYLDFFGQFSNTTIITTNASHYSLAEQTSFLRTLNKYNLDLVHFPNFNVPILYKRPFVVTIHDVVHHKISGAKKTHLLHFYAYKRVIKAAVKNSIKILTVSEFSKQDIHLTLGVPLEKIEVIYEGPTLNSGNVTDTEVEKVKRYFLLKRPYLLFVGVLERKKNLKSLTRGLDLFLKKYQIDLDLVIVGKIDKHYPDIKHEAADITHKDHLVFTGYTDDSELKALYQGAYAYANASLHEGFGLPGIEAMQFGLPLLVSNIPVFNEIYDNAAVYFNAEDVNDIAEKFYLLTRDEQFYNQMKSHSLKRAGLFDWKNAAKETLKIYQQAL